MIRKACASIPGVEVDTFGGLLADYVKETRAQAVVRGLRSVSDFESECQMAQVNQQVLPGMETLFMMTRPEHAHISSSVVRELASFGGDVQAYIPPEIREDVLRYYTR